MSDVMERDDTKVLICVAKDKDEVWSNVFGSGWEYLDWITSVTYKEGDWDTHGIAVVTYLDPEDPREEATLSKELTVVDLANAWSNLTTSGWVHCGEESLDEPDACSTDAVLQQALFGELIYG